MDLNDAPLDPQLAKGLVSSPVLGGLDGSVGEGYDMGGGMTTSTNTMGVGLLAQRSPGLSASQSSPQQPLVMATKETDEAQVRRWWRWL